MRQNDTLDFVHHGDKYFLHHLSIDCVIFGYHERQLKVLLLKWKNAEKWSLPGGFIKLEETLEDAASRILTERTGLSQLFLQQFHTFGEPKRSVRTAADIAHLESIWKTDVPKEHWLLKRTVSIGYYSVTEYSQVNPQPDYLSDECTWHDIHSIPQLVFDHNLIVTEALKALRMQINLQPIGYNLLPKKFTLPEIHDLYETILDKKLDRRNFPKKLLSLGIIKKLDEQKSIGAHRSPFLYKFDKRKYDKALKEGIVLAF
ncbi:NUDIX hydrolase [Ilyomonas limi]|jgi:ADP-ribose pyrophosphatase YjhB (NUDIX family)|uniref:NUDIX hydrolase n=1 Tax=Ilyomonas limi TaxID=2575867 RepID=A0A4U3KSU3_9BACT|nr:NUDIX domain-containing protein [Ilyomonas limi]TKK65555.1 NUDIX hydrolase [Ilyomonas limi]